ncbi:MAG: hypothetical protein E6Q97_34330 [Desulfurellales bacterium]|nr:MAG: hypothetical protein E6Q97_34330 [Desulfurellales bacterium]
MSNIWYTSDTHFGHARIAEFCPQRVGWFGMNGPNDIDKMNEMLVLAWNAQVEPGDIVYHLGDFAMGQIDKTLNYVSRLNGDIRLILGNHDRPSRAYSKSVEKQMEWEQHYLDAGFTSLSYEQPHAVEGVTFWVAHFPYTGDTQGEDRHAEFRMEDRGEVLVHGHVHDMWQVNGRQINVGWDAWGRLLHSSEVVDLVRSVS